MKQTRSVVLLLVTISKICFSQSQLEIKTIGSLKHIFGDSVTIESKPIILSADDKQQIFEKSHRSWQSDTVVVYRCTLDRKVVGFGFVDNVKGKTQLITYLVALNPPGEVCDVDVLVYRESFGGEIAYESFRKQFREKTVHDELRPGKDIKNISGATISVRAITIGVKRILATFEVLLSRLSNHETHGE